MMLMHDGLLRQVRAASWQIEYLTREGRRAEAAELAASLIDLLNRPDVRGLDRADLQAELREAHRLLRQLQRPAALTCISGRGAAASLLIPCIAAGAEVGTRLGALIGCVGLFAGPLAAIGLVTAGALVGFLGGLCCGFLYWMLGALLCRLMSGMLFGLLLTLGTLGLFTVTASFADAAGIALVLCPLFLIASTWGHRRLAVRYACSL